MRFPVFRRVRACRQRAVMPIGSAFCALGLLWFIVTGVETASAWK